MTPLEEVIFYIVLVLLLIGIAAMYAKMLLIHRDVMLEQNQRRHDDFQKLNESVRNAGYGIIDANPKIAAMIKSINNAGATVEDLRKVHEAIGKIKFSDLAEANRKTTGRK